MLDAAIQLLRDIGVLPAIQAAVVAMVAITILKYFLGRGD